MALAFFALNTSYNSALQRIKKKKKKEEEGEEEKEEKETILIPGV
jgi:hypothetical protein